MTDTKQTIGCLFLHGFTSSLDTVRGNREWLEKENIQYSMPILRGHGGKPEDLAGVTWKDWYSDAEESLDELSQRCSKVIVIGLSMGGLQTLELGIRKPDTILAQVLVATALRYKSNLIFLLPLLAGIFKYWPAPNPYNDQQCAAANTNYSRFPTESFVSLYGFSKEIEKKLGQVTLPTLILHSKKDGVISPGSAEIIYNSIASREKKLIWFEKSGHEMMQDLEADLVIASIRDYVLDKISSFCG